MKSLAFVNLSVHDSHSWTVVSASGRSVTIFSCVCLCLSMWLTFVKFTSQMLQVCCSSEKEQFVSFWNLLWNYIFLCDYCKMTNIQILIKNMSDCQMGWQTRWFDFFYCKWYNAWCMIWFHPKRTSISASDIWLSFITAIIFVNVKLKIGPVLWNFGFGYCASWGGGVTWTLGITSNRMSITLLVHG